MDDRYPDFWAESNWPRRPRRDPFRMRLLALLAAGALLTPIALLMRRNDGDVVTTGRLPGAAVALEPVLSGGAATTTTAPAQVVDPQSSAAGTLPPAVGATVARPASGAAPAAASGAGTLPPTVGTLPVTIAPPAPAESSSGDSPSDGGASAAGSTVGDSSGSTSAAGNSSEEGSDPDPAVAPRRSSVAPTQPPVPPAPEAAPTAPAPKPTPAPSPPPVQYSAKQVEALIRKAFPDDQEDKALAVAWRESRHDPRAYNGWCCYGLFQIYFEANASFLATLGITSAEQLLDPVVNTSAALAMFQRSGWGPWGG
jgi:hypothetical protein